MLKTTSKDATSTPEKEGEHVNADLETIKIQLHYCQEMLESKERIIKLLEANSAFKDEKLEVLASDNNNLKILLKDCQKKKNYSQPAE